MSQRLDIARQNYLEPRRMASCKLTLEEMGFDVTVAASPAGYGTTLSERATRLEFFYKGKRIMFWPYSGWHTGKTIKDGRGFQHLVEQLVPEGP